MSDERNVISPETHPGVKLRYIPGVEKSVLKNLTTPPATLSSD